MRCSLQVAGVAAAGVSSSTHGPPSVPKFGSEQGLDPACWSTTYLPRRIPRFPVAARGDPLGIKGFIPPKMPKLDLTTDSEYVAN